MTFLQGWWLAAGALALGAVIALHTLRPVRKEKVVSSLFLWRDIQREIAANRRRRRILSSLLLALQLAALGLLAFILAGPSLRADEPPHHVAIVVDTSASMGILERNGVRSDLARARLGDFLSSGSASRYLLWSTSPADLQYEGPSKRDVLDALADLPAPAGSSDWEGVLRRVRSTVSPDVPYSLVLVTDEAADPAAFDALADLGPNVRAYLIRVGTSAANVGITSFTARPSGDLPGDHQVLVKVGNYSGESREIALQVVSRSSESQEDGDPEGGAERLLDTTLALAPGASESAVFTHLFRPGEYLMATLAEGDALTVDDRAYLVAAKPRPARILMVGGPSYFLEQGLLAFPQVRLEHAIEAPPEREARSYDLAVFYDTPVPSSFPIPAVYFASEGSLSTSGQGAGAVWWNRAHPLSRFVDWEGIHYGGIEPLSPLPSESTLVESDAGPLLTVVETTEYRVVRVAIPLQASDFPFRVAFPVFLQNLLDWARPSSAQLVPDPVSPGDLPAAALEAWSTAEDGMIQIEDAATAAADDGRSFTMQWSRDRVPAMEPGVYTWRAGEEEGRFAVSLVDPGESDLRQRAETRLTSLGVSPLGGRAVFSDLVRPSASSELRTSVDPWEVGAWRWGALAVLVILVMEGIVYVGRHGGRGTRIRPGFNSAVFAKGAGDR